MYFTIGIGLFALCLIVHELAHALAMRKEGIEFEKIAFGLKIPFIPNISWQSKKIFPGTKIEINHLPIIAFVKPTFQAIEDLKNLEISKQALIFGAGVMSNIVLAVIFLDLSILSDPEINGINIRIMVFLGLQLSLIVCLWIFRRFFCEHLIPIVGIFVLWFVAYSIAKDPVSNGGGIIDIVSVIKEESTNLHEAMIIAMAISLALALFNMIPIMPLDGAKVISIKLSRNNSIFSFYFDIIGIVMFLGLLILALGNDAFKIIKSIFF